MHFAYIMLRQVQNFAYVKHNINTNLFEKAALFDTTTCIFSIMLVLLSQMNGFADQHLCLELEDDELLVYTGRLVPTSQYYPLRFLCIRELNKLSLKTATHIPVLPFLMEVT